MADTGYPTEHFESPEHAITAGTVLGAAQRQGLNLVPVMDAKGNYTNRFEVIDETLSDRYRVFITVEPPVEKPWPIKGRKEDEK